MPDHSQHDSVAPAAGALPRQLGHRARALACATIAACALTVSAPSFSAAGFAEATPAPARASTAGPDFAAVVQRNGAAVVNVSNNSSVKLTLDAPSASGADASADDAGGVTALLRSFGGPDGKLKSREFPVHAEGSGFIISADGRILTNAHVVQGAKEVIVKLTDRREFVAKVLGSDTVTDIALLQIDAHDLPTVQVGQPSQLRVGEWVLAIGSPFGFENSVTVGVVSATGRSLPGDTLVPFIQTDAAVNPGNSGGPLFNAGGEVIGINSQIYSRTGAFQGLSFAIPIDVAMRVADDLASHGRAAHAALGIGVQEVDQTLAESFKLDKARGALITNVNAGSPAARVGLHPGDVVLAADGEPVVTSNDLARHIGFADPGGLLKLQVWRNGRAADVRVQLAVADATPPPAPRRDAERLSRGAMSLTLRPLTDAELGAAGIGLGLMVEQATGSSALAGVQPGDILLAINNEPLASVAQARVALAHADRAAALLIQRADARLFVPIRLGS